MSAGHWSSPNGCHPDCPACAVDKPPLDTDRWSLDDWKYDVANGDTRLGYEDWVRHNMEADTAGHCPDCDTLRDAPTDQEKCWKCGSTHAPIEKAI